MKALSVGELKAQFSEVLEKVKQGEKNGILYGKKKKPIAMIVPFSEVEEKKRGRLEYWKVNIKLNLLMTLK